jgi:hypothetical protein
VNSGSVLAHCGHGSSIIPVEPQPGGDRGSGGEADLGEKISGHGPGARRFWHSMPACRTAANSGRPRMEAKSGSLSIAGQAQ